MIDIVRELNAIHRDVSRRQADDGETVAVLLRRRYDADAEDVWNALTDPERLRRWFLPISGDLRVGGRFQLEGNAGGQILTCNPPSLLRVTFGDASSVVEVRLAADGGATALELEHTVPAALAGGGAGALYVGPGWDGALLGLGLFLRGEAVGDPAEAANSPEALDFSARSVHAWSDVVAASGTATAEELTAATEVSLAQFAPQG